MDAPRYVHLLTIQKRARSQRSPVVFIHGFPDSPEIFRDYHHPTEQKESWLKGRNIFAIAFPNRLTHPVVPTLKDLWQDVLFKEFAAHLQTLVRESPTGKIAVVAHDWGAAYTWRFVRELGGEGIDRMLALSVAATPQFDIWEHGVRALSLSYRSLLSLPYYIPATSEPVAWLLSRLAGYSGPDWKNLSKDCYHYWADIVWPLKAPFVLLGLLDRPGEELDFKFPVVFLRSSIDRLWSTEAFEQKLLQRRDCKLVILKKAQHWFPEHQSRLVIKELRTFFDTPLETKSITRVGAEAVPAARKKSKTSQAEANKNSPSKKKKSKGRSAHLSHDEKS